MDHRWRTSALALLACLGLALGGCSQSPLAPGESAPSGTARDGSPPMLTVGTDGEGEYVPCQSDAEGERLPVMDSTGSRATSTTCKIDGEVGGTLKVGRFTLELPPGSFSGSGNVTMAMRDTTVLVCELEISPLSANAFRQPARLTADLSGLNVSEKEVAIYWYDPSKAKWENVAAVVKESSCVTAYLSHFSTYGAGKAGW